jgi:hypothetical protein
MKKTFLFLGLAICLGLVVWFQLANATSFSYTYSFYCPNNSWASGYGESQIFYPTQNGQIRLWCTEISLGGAWANVYEYIFRNDVCLNWQDPSARKCRNWGPYDVVTTDQLNVQIEIACQAGPAGTVTARAACLDNGMMPGTCDVQPKPK